jgi:hypothetical protein
MAPTSGASNTNSGMSGWPVNRPSARDSASVSIGYFCDSVRKVGASARTVPALADRVARRAVCGQQGLAALQLQGDRILRGSTLGDRRQDGGEQHQSRQQGRHRQFTGGGALAAMAS